MSPDVVLHVISKCPSIVTSLNNLFNAIICSAGTIQAGGLIPVLVLRGNDTDGGTST